LIVHAVRAETPNGAPPLTSLPASAVLGCLLGLLIWKEYAGSKGRGAAFVGLALVAVAAVLFAAA
jgi:membrane-bound metal-dependent hydrolase YbcI (DUF457 family)